AVVQRPGRYFEQLSTRGVPVLSDKNDFLDCWLRDDANRSWMHHNFANTFMTRRFNHAIFSNLNMTAFVCNARAKDFRFTHSVFALPKRAAKPGRIYQFVFR